MRTTLRIDDELLKEAKRIALESERTLSQVVEEALRETFARMKADPGKEKGKLPSFRGKGLQPGITWEDLNSNSRMLDIMDGYDFPNRSDANPGR
jgi:hypothetical protein